MYQCDKRYVKFHGYKIFKVVHHTVYQNTKLITGFRRFEISFAMIKTSAKITAATNLSHAMALINKQL